MRSCFHLVGLSPWPIFGSLAAFNLIVAVISFFRGGLKLFTFIFLTCAFIVLMVCFYGWLRDVSREGTYCGRHTLKVVRGLKIGMLLFILSEVMFFFGFFWAFFHSSLAPSGYGLLGWWPPCGIEVLNPMEVPLLNTAVLLLSGFTVTVSHSCLRAGQRVMTLGWLLFTILLGLYFTSLQYFEYLSCSFTIADSVYGSLFFVITGFHGAHVLIGTIMLSVGFFRVYNYNVSSGHHVGFLTASWYWHFVDFIWIGVYLILYWWGSVDDLSCFWLSWADMSSSTLNWLSAVEGFIFK